MLGKKTFDVLIDERDFFIPLVLEHIYISSIAVIISTILGLGLGIFISQYKYFKFPVLSLTGLIYTIPTIAMLGFLTPLTGVGNMTAIIVLVIYALLPMVRNTYIGITDISSDIIEAADAMGSTKFQLLTRIKLPLALPVILTGFRNMVVMTISLAGIASFIGAGGLGTAIYRGISSNNIQVVLVGSILIALLAFISDQILINFLKLVKLKKYLNLKIKSAVIIVFIIFVFIFNLTGKQYDISVASKLGTEQFILSEILKILIEENSDLKVKLYKGVGGSTAGIHEGMIKGDFDLYAEYTGTAWLYLLQQEYEPDHDKLQAQLEKIYSEEYGIEWISYYGFNNSYALTVRTETAEKYNLQKSSDVTAIADELVFGANYDYYERDDGFYAMADAYDLKFKKTIDMEIGLRYIALESKEIDILPIFTTDGEVLDLDVKILDDDKNFFKKYMAGNVIRKEILVKHPELREILGRLNNTMDNREISKLNYEVNIKKRIDSDVAREWLIKKGLIKDNENNRNR